MISSRSNQINMITDFILDSNSFASTTQQRDNTEDYYWFNGQYYELGAEGLILDLISQNFQTVRSCSTIWAIIDKVQQLSLTDNLDNHRYACYLNGVYDAKLHQLYPYSSRYYLTHQINQNYIQDNTSSLSLTLNAKRLEMLNFVD